jgi:HSF-type DNA-binding
MYAHQYHAARYGLYSQAALQQSQSFNGFYYSPPPIYPYVSTMSQLQYFSSSSQGGAVTGEQQSRESTSNNNNTDRNGTTASSSSSMGTGRHRGGVAEPFPEKLYRMLDTCEKEGKADVVSFSVHGNTFAIHKPKRFAVEVMSRFFKQSKLTSFQRQLNLYGFKRISTGPDNGSYWVRKDDFCFLPTMFSSLSKVFSSCFVFSILSF